MLNIVICGSGLKYNQYVNMIKFYELLKDFKVVGILSTDAYFQRIDGYKYLSMNELDILDVDCVLFSSKKDVAYLKDVRDIPMLPIEVLSVRGFDIKKHLRLWNSNLSIIANNCWGGTTYHYMGLRFNSPFINMFVKDKDYLKLIKNLKYYLNCDPKISRMEFNPDLDIKYPVVTLDNEVEIYMNHYFDVDDALEKWAERCKRINYDNLFIMMHTMKKKYSDEFEKISYNKKVCFVPYESSGNCMYTVKPYLMRNNKDAQFWEFVNGMAKGRFPCYDVYELLLNGVIKERISDE